MLRAQKAIRAAKRLIFQRTVLRFRTQICLALELTLRRALRLQTKIGVAWLPFVPGAPRRGG
jgi:hypothetical protein